ncbi:pyruvate kinase [Amaricoccus sp.]|uniref:pyruvate kinase n=1 Tax=Amaricoccus sp. TaxID=1872485 RepID=UPI001B5DE391|nr:pyruvate kinase [Amaricoccus sp.]MBP7000131.1 pyruvate kinase [Amaricoccus sp.]
MNPTRRQRSVKIVATLGPASDTLEMIRALFLAGADVFRLNMSHGTQADIGRRFDLIRQVEDEVGRPIGVLADLQGPKLRVGAFRDGPHLLAEGDRFRLDLDEAEGDAGRVCLPHPEIFQALEVGSTLLVNDGKIRLKVLDCSPSHAETEVVVGGEISNRKGVNVPDVVLPLAALSKKDRSDLEFACGLGVDWLALSFVQRAEDVHEARELAKGRAAILSKIEKPAAVKAFAEILDASDGIMVARGDLGVELPVYSVPPIQKRLTRACRAAGKPVIVATQMLESMITAPVPTRAEVSDVATAIYEGVDAVMLSAESAAGDYPIEAVTTMDNVARSVEADDTYRAVIEAQRSSIHSGAVSDAITSAAREVAETTKVKAICCFSHSGTTASLAARERPRVPIIALTPLIRSARRLALTWGLHCVVVPEVDRFKMAVVSAARTARDQGFAAAEDRIVVTAGIPFGVAGSTNILRVATCSEKAIFEGGAED